jgi:hypothetical protein
MSLRDAWLVLAGLAIGFLGSWCGIGGGLFAVPLLHFVRKLELRAAVATALVLVLATSTAATAAEALSPEPRASSGRSSRRSSRACSWGRSSATGSPSA